MSDHIHFEQGPGERVPYGVKVVGDTINTASWSISPGGTVSGTIVQPTQTTTFVSNLTLGLDYELDGVVITTEGSVRDVCIHISCVDPCAE